MKCDKLYYKLIVNIKEYFFSIEEECYSYQGKWVSSQSCSKHRLLYYINVQLKRIFDGILN